MTQLTEQQLQILRHMLGIDRTDVKEPESYRNYFCADPGDPELKELERIGAVRMYSAHGSYEWFSCTEAGIQAARASQRAMLLPLSKRRYLRFRELTDCLPDLTFREFLTSPEFAEERRAA